MGKQAKANLHIWTVWPEPSLFAHIIYGTRGSFKEPEIWLVCMAAGAFERSQTTQHKGFFSHEVTQSNIKPDQD